MKSIFQVDIDFEKDPIGTGKDGKKVYFKDIWPSTEEVAEVGIVKLAGYPVHHCDLMSNCSPKIIILVISVLGCSIFCVA